MIVESFDVASRIINFLVNDMSEARIPIILKNVCKFNLSDKLLWPPVSRWLWVPKILGMSLAKGNRS